MRAYGPSLRNAISVCTGNRIKAYGAGLGVTSLVQSSTATALIVSNFAGRGMVATAAALALMLGADLGSTLLAQVLSLGVGWLSPILIALGVIVFLSVEAGRPRHLARTVIGLGLMLLALNLIGTASAPLRDSQGLVSVFALLSNERLIAMLLAALLTWLAHSSLAIVLLIMSFAASGIVPVPLALTLVIGANIGGALAPVIMTMGGSAQARRVPLGNLMMRALGGVVALATLDLILPYVSLIEADAARQVVNFHTGFNLALGLVFLPLVSSVARLCERLLPDSPNGSDEMEPRNLDPHAIGSPNVALACASREALRMGDTVYDMLDRSMQALLGHNTALVREVESCDDQVDSLHEAIKLFIVETSKSEMDAEESRRAVEILSFTANLEHIGDIIDKNLMELASKKIRNRLNFSPEGRCELEQFHGTVLENCQLALNVFVSRDLEMAQSLLEKKQALRDDELAAASSHYSRVGAGRAESIETSSIHLDIIRDLKRINSHLAAVAYPILEEAGVLRSSRLKKKKIEEMKQQVQELSGDEPLVTRQ